MRILAGFNLDNITEISGCNNGFQYNQTIGDQSHFVEILLAYMLFHKPSTLLQMIAHHNL